MNVSKKERREKGVKTFFEKEMGVVNVGIKTFYETLKSQGVRVTHVDWRPPAGGDEALTSLLDKIL
jgi:hypothetical protein